MDQILNIISAILLGYFIYLIAQIFTGVSKKLSFKSISWMPWRSNQRLYLVLMLISIFLTIYASQILILQEYLVYLFWSFSFLSIIITDLKERKILTLNLFFLFIGGCLVNFFTYQSLFILFSQIALGLIIFLGLFLIKKVYFFIKKIDGLGMGDCILISLIGLWQGIHITLLVVVLSSLTAMIYVLIFIKKNPLKYQLPFGSFIGVVCLILPLVNVNLF